MSDVALWQLIKDWLPQAGWEILRVQAPFLHINGDELPAFIVHNIPPEPYVLHVPEEPVGVKDQYKTYPPDQLCMILDNEVAFFDKGMWSYKLKASDPEFFDKLDTILLTLFSKAEWWQHKMGRAVAGHKEKIWPK